MRDHVLVNGFESTHVWAAWFYGNEAAFWVRGPVEIQHVQKIVDVGSTERQ